MLKHFTIVFLLFTSVIFGFDSIEVLDSKIKIHTAGWLKSDVPLTPKEAYEHFQKGRYTAFAPKVKSFGFSTAEHWSMFELSSAQDETHFFLDLKDALAESCALFIFVDGKLVKEEQSGYIVPLKNRPMQQFSIRFSLKDTEAKTIYLLKTISQYPMYPAYAFGSQPQLDESWDINHMIFTLSCGMFIVMFLYNMFLYFIIRDRAYLFYCLYIFGYFMITLLAQGYIALVWESLVTYTPMLLAFFLQAKFIGLAFFTIYFLNLSKTFPSLKKTIRYLLYANITASLTVPFAVNVQILSIIFMNLLYATLIYAGFRSYFSKFQPALYYLLATGIALVCSFAYSLMNQGVFFSYNILSFNLMSFGLIWDMILLAFALAYRIKILREQNTQKERLLMLQSRQKNIGELTGNIAHQWRQPLGKMGSLLSMLEAKLKYENIQKEEMLETIMQSNRILQYLSQTINTFQSFFHVKQTNELFDVEKTLENVVAFVKESLLSEQIEITLHVNKNAKLKGDENGLFQAVLNIILNAKDALFENKNDTKLIHIELICHDTFIEIAIENNGGNIMITPIEKIFELFITDKSEGSGMGLFITKMLVESQLGGHIDVQNTHKGVCFRLRFKTSD